MNLPKILHLAYRSRMKTRNWHRIVRAMAMVVVFCTTYALILPAITMESGTVCGITAHSHTEQCYETATVLHSHDESCYNKTAICGMEEHPAHTHLAECTGFVPTLICELPEEGHRHNAACYSYEQGLVCGLTESEGHSHSDACYQLELTCGLSEAQEVTVTNLICGYEEHVHEESCYPAPTETTAGETLPAVGDPNADVETESDWLESFASAALTEDWSENLLAIAQCQLGYAESKRNLSYDEAGNIFGYTRYGAWYGQPYGRWDAMFVSFCLHYAGVEGIPYGSDTAQWLEALTQEGLYLPKAEYIPVSGDLVFLDRDYDEEADHVGIVSSVDSDTGMVTLIAGDWDHRVDWVEVDETAILGYVPLPEEPAEEPESYFGQSEAGIAAEVLLRAALPEGAELTVTPIAEDREDYAAMAAQVSGAVAENIEKLTLLDLSFYASGEYLPVSDSATVTLYFEGDIFQNRQVKVFHLTENGPTELNSTATTFTTFSLREENTQTMLTFETEGFSVFAVVEVVGAYERVNVTNISELANNDYYIVSNNTNYIMLDEMETTDSTDMGLAKGTFNGVDSLAGKVTWTFIPATGDTFYVKSSNGKYLVMADTTDNSAAVSLTTEESSATMFTLRAVNGQVEIGYDGPNGSAHYINVFNGNTDFRGWIDSADNDGGSKVYLYRKTAASDTTIPATDLGGKSFAIVSNYADKALTTTSATVNNVPGLQAKDISIVTIDGANYVEGDIPLWTFEATDTAGVYHISTTSATGDKQYLRLLSQDYSSTSPDGRGSLTVETTDTPQAITVLTSDDGTIMLSAKNSNGNTGYVNLDTAVNNFWTYSGIADSNKLRLYSKTSIDSSFTITYDNTYTITFNLVDSVGNSLYATRTDRTLASTDEGEIKFADIAPTIEGYTYNSAHYTKNYNTYSVASVGPFNDKFRLYTPTHVEGTDDGQYYTQTGDVTVTLVYQNNLLNYDLNRPSGTWFHNNAGWDASDPSITSTSQDIAEDTDGQTLHTVDGRNLFDKFVLNTLTERGNEVNYYNDCNQDRYTAGTLTADNYLAPGAEYIFLGWQATINGTTHLFPEDAAITIDDNGDFRIVDTDGNTQTVPAGTTLVGQWKQVSNAVMFFVNHGDTMLEKEDNLAITRTDSGYYTGIVALGHIYNPPAQDIGTGNIQKATHDLIEAQLKPYYDPSSSATQLVVDAINISTTSTSSYQTVDHYNETLLENAASSYIRNHTSGTILLDNAELDKSEITPDNYKLYWYVQKRVDTDGYAYHIDGVLVAKTQPMEIYKTFSGLTTDQADDAIEQMTFPLHLVSQVTLDGAEVDKKNAYTTLKAADSQSGVYTFDGRQTKGNIFKWTLESVQGQRYTFEEEGYDVTGYDCSSLVSVHYADGAVVYKYNTDATYTDATENTDAITDLFADKPLVGGQVESIIFANFYTQTGTGMFSISKVADDIGQLRLPGAEFTLTLGDTVITQTTNENGAAHFSDLAPGTYTLKETTAPTGYQSLDTIWTVVVAKEDTGGVTVTIDGKKVYDSENGGIQEDGVYLIQNTPQNTTVTVNKDFSDQLTDNEIGELKDYAIAVKDGDGTVVKTLTLQDATAITGSINAYTWTIDLTCGSTYQFVESGYSHKNYLDTVVSASVNGAARTVTKSEDNTTASFSMVKGEAADTVNITNDYTNTFDLQIHKVNATAGTGEDPNMSGVKFNIYGDFQFHQKPSDDTAASIPYTYNGTEGTAWYIGTTEATNDDGYTLFRDMHLTSGTDTFLYVIDEANTPAGFVKLDEPIVRVVRVNGGDPNYSNGVYTLTVENFKPDLATVTVTATKQWDLPEGMNPAEVTLTLYKKDADNRISEVQTVTLDGTANTPTETDGITASIDDWTVVWSGLTYADGATPNVYYVAETPMDGYNTSYNTHVSKNSVGTQQIEMALAEGYNLKRSVTITNSSGYELPSTGSLGVGWIYILGLGLMGAALWLHRLDVIKKRQGGMDSS
ncbi:MAG: Cna B-type domain-containing protein [Oscillospiraceae bacterium]|nr:Cna B-type domain-containing protein [Oscillospiraceae bacterium]